MKSSKIILVLFVIGNFYISYSQNWLTSGNTLTTGNEFIGSNSSSTNPGLATFEWTKYLRPYAVTLKNGKTKKNLQFRIQA